MDEFIVSRKRRNRVNSKIKPISIEDFTKIIGRSRGAYNHYLWLFYRKYDYFYFNNGKGLNRDERYALNVYDKLLYKNKSRYLSDKPINNVIDNLIDKYL